MKILDLALQAANMKSWPSRREGDAIKIEVPTQGGRTQVVQVEMGRDADGDAAGFVWSKAADAQAIQQPWDLLRLNSELTYGKCAERTGEIVILHGIYDDAATLADVGKAIYWVARAADDLEARIYGSDNL